MKGDEAGSLHIANPVFQQMPVESLFAMHLPVQGSSTGKT
jgi:hypothetical protein